MTIAELHNMNFNDVAERLYTECDSITDYEALKDFAKSRIDEDNLNVAVHILQHIWVSPAYYFDYDYCMGTLEKPTPLLVVSDLEDYCEQEE